MRGGALQDPLLSMCRAWDLAQRLKSREWELEAAMRPGDALLAYSRYALAHVRQLVFEAKDGSGTPDRETNGRVERLLGKQVGRTGGLAHHRTVVESRKTSRPGGDKAGRSKEYVVKRARLSEVHEADTPAAPQ